MFQYDASSGDFSQAQQLEFFPELQSCVSYLGGRVPSSAPSRELLVEFAAVKRALVAKDKATGHDRREVVSDSGESLDPYVFEFAYSLIASRRFAIWS